MKNNPFIEVLTRTFNARPIMLAKNQNSLRRQTFKEWQQTLLIDEEKRGIEWSHTNMARYAPNLIGEYIWILDDDDECIRDTLFEEVYYLSLVNPEIIFVKMNHGDMGVLPSVSWGKEPAHGQFGSSSYFVRRDIWQKYAYAWEPVYHGDFLFIREVYKNTANYIWHDVIASRVQRISKGKAEDE